MSATIKKFCACCFFIFTIVNVVAQKKGDEIIIIGEYKTLYSEFLDEDRLITVHLPKGYKDSKRNYPVVYLSYGDRIEQYFSNAVSVLHNLDDAGPELILIGIDERNLRYRDLLPQGNDGTPTGIDAFSNYLSKELIPYVESTYRTNDFRVFVGPQVGANFALYTLFQNPDMFDAYITTNPFRWSGGRDLLFENVSQYLKDHDTLQKFLFISHDNDDPLERKGNDYIEQFKKRIDDSNLKNFRIHFNFISEGYASVSPLGLDKGLRKLFEGYQIPEEISIQSLNDLQGYYNKLTEKLGFKVVIPDRVMAIKSDELVDIEQLETAEELLKYAEQVYPNSFNPAWRLGQLYRKKGMNSLAIKYYKKVLRIYPDMKMAQDFIDDLSK